MANINKYEQKIKAAIGVYDVVNIVCYEEEARYGRYNEKEQRGAIMFDIDGVTFRCYTDERWTDAIECVRKKRITAAKAATLSKRELIDRCELLGRGTMRGELLEEVNDFLRKLWWQKEVRAIKVPDFFIEALLH